MKFDLTVTQIHTLEKANEPPAYKAVMQAKGGGILQTAEIKLTLKTTAVEDIQSLVSALGQTVTLELTNPQTTLKQFQDGQQDRQGNKG